MSLAGKHALITGSSRGIGRGIALKLADKGVRVAVHYYRNKDAADSTLQKIREAGSDGFIVQADVCHPDGVSKIFEEVKSNFGSLDIFVSNARTEAPTFYQAPMEITLDKWDTAVDSQAKFLVGVREAAPFNGKRWPDHCYHLRTWRPVWKLAALGSHGSSQSGDGSADPLFRGRPRRPRNYGQHAQSGLD
jgi:NAD(P)-dependent dehydrogenase (short-subunit alcohol dehydrogenase family)